MGQPHPFLAVLVALVIIAMGVAIIVLAPVLYELNLKFAKWQVEKIGRISGVLAFPSRLSLFLLERIGPKWHVLNIRFGGAILITFGVVLLGLLLRQAL